MPSPTMARGRSSRPKRETGSASARSWRPPAFAPTSESGGTTRSPTNRIRIRTLIFRSSELSAHLGGELIGPDVSVEGASIDSRTIRPGQLYVAIAAERDAHAFIRAALEAG